MFVLSNFLKAMASIVDIILTRPALIWFGHQRRELNQTESWLLAP